MVVGGRQTSGRFDPSPVFVLVGEIYDPGTDSWAVTPPMTYGRQYHSSVVLLPDGRVFCFGRRGFVAWRRSRRQSTDCRSLLARVFDFGQSSHYFQRAHICFIRRDGNGRHTGRWKHCKCLFDCTGSCDPSYRYSPALHQDWLQFNCREPN